MPGTAETSVIYSTRRIRPRTNTPASPAVDVLRP